MTTSHDQHRSTGIPVDPEALREAVRALEAEMDRPGNMFAYDIAIVLSALQEAREALGPFSAAWAKFDTNAPYSTSPRIFPALDDFRRAAEVFRALSPGGAAEARAHADPVPRPPHRHGAQRLRAEGSSMTVNEQPKLDLAEAAKPFVAHYEAWMDEWPDDAQTSTFARVTFGQLRTLRALIARVQEAEGKGSSQGAIDGRGALPTPPDGAGSDDGGVGDYQLHPKTAALVRRFMSALASKLSAAEVKYGYSDAWVDPAWEDECRRQLHHHAAKGDPRDVAAYAAFCWHHGWSTASPIREPEISREALGEAIYLALYEHQGAVWAANESKGVWYDAADRLRAILNLAPVGGRGEEGSARADLSPASRSQDQHSDGGEG